MTMKLKFHAGGIKAKTKVVLEHMERDGKKIAEENRQNYKKMLEEQREKRNEILNK